MARRWLVGILGSTLVLLGAGALVVTTAPTIDVQGHRGARGLLPENSLSAFAAARKLGVSTLELDTNVTADDVLVITHDPRLNPSIARDASGRWVSDPTPSVRSLSFDQLSSYDVGRLQPGTEYAARFPTQRPVDGTRIPSLAALFDQVQASGDTSVRFNIETKLEPDAPELSPSPAQFADLLITEIRSHHLEERTTIQSFDWRTLAEVQRRAPEIPTVALTEADRATLDGPWTNGLRLAEFGGSVPRLVHASGASIWSPDVSTLTTNEVDVAHRLGLKVIPWTVNEPAEIRRVIDMGVDGAISDYPGRAIDVVNTMQKPLLNPLFAGVGIAAGLVVLLAGITGRPRRMFE